MSVVWRHVLPVAAPTSLQSNIAVLVVRYVLVHSYPEGTAAARLPSSCFGSSCEHRVNIVVVVDLTQIQSSLRVAVKDEQQGGYAEVPAGGKH